MWFKRSSRCLLPPSLPSKSATDIASAAKLSEQAQTLLEPQITAGKDCLELTEHKMNVEVVPFLVAHLMPPEKGVQWAVKSCQMAAPGGPSCAESAKAVSGVVVLAAAQVLPNVLIPEMTQVPSDQDAETVDVSSSNMVKETTEAMKASAQRAAQIVMDNKQLAKTQLIGIKMIRFSHLWWSQSVLGERTS